MLSYQRDTQMPEYVLFVFFFFSLHPMWTRCILVFDLGRARLYLATNNFCRPRRAKRRQEKKKRKKKGCVTDNIDVFLLTCFAKKRIQKRQAFPTPHSHDYHGRYGRT